MSNRLIQSQSPYLLQHAHNPVDWFPWGPEALQKAETENKPILVSIGYSACHWCHVMERESFEDEVTAELMNEHFVCIKIDREERPDIDNIYMDAVQAMGLQGGWPLNVFLMPNQKPFYGGTYFPNLQWKQLLANIANAFEKHEDQLAESAESFGRSLSRKETEKYGIAGNASEFDPDDLMEIITKLSSQFDPEWGGMNRAPKFPMPTIWDFVLDYALLSKNPDLQEKVFFTLKKIGMGGIYDHLRGGFARYSVDGEWFAPHFEKMLYDNGQLLELYAKAYQVSRDAFFLEKVTETVNWLEAEMLQEEGGFHAAQDADSEGVEGKFYTWTYAELQALMPDELPWLSKLYNLKPNGNWEDGVNILFQTESYAEITSQFKLEENELVDKLNAVKAKLLEVRNQRIFPGKDDKILAGWNGLMSAGLIQAYHATGEKRMLDLALKNLGFVREKMIVSGVLHRSYKNGQAYTPAFLEDYAAVIRAALMAFEASGDVSWLNFAKDLTDFCLDQFYDESDGFFFFNNPKAEKLIANKKELFDNVIPASNSIMARNLHRLSLLTYEEKYSEIAQKMLGGMKDLVLRDPGFLSNWAHFLLESLVPSAEIAIVGTNAKSKAEAFQQAYTPNSVLSWSENLTENVPLLQGKTPDAEGNALIYICFDRACRRPVASWEEAIAQLPYLA
ncbi:thioredoxin domain-containing protein [Algoriphagus aestuariicola]|uniref:Thioredoxin domain-containing protein n=1 Tax=Algoriphagus aestuariicola TaxID=1852016 RepID=A0ABS3BT99_9BACT|nr:thioredoxin domain-containing protein [Algoriphagus aestuariicola]MBN7801570.1 thioredoxin domain-containing protein [Algoriphagus aestuariicola]